MKKFLLILLASLVSATVWAARPTSFDGGDGDGDLFPWPWGTECPFPWQEIEGTYLVKGGKFGFHTGHIIKVAVSQTDDSGLEFLSMEEFDRLGYLYAKGQGYAQENERIVKGLLTDVETDKSFTVMVRSYARQKNASCSSDLVTAVTFCPLRGKKCKTDTSYILERMGQ